MKTFQPIYAIKNNTTDIEAICEIY